MLGGVAGTGRAGMDAIEAHLAAIHLHIYGEGGDMLLTEIPFLHFLYRIARIEKKAIMVLLVQKIGVGILAFDIRQRFAPAGIGFRQEENVGIAVANSGEHGGMILILLQHVEQQDGQRRTGRARLGAAQFALPAGQVGQDICRTDQEGDGIGHEQAGIADFADRVERHIDCCGGRQDKAGLQPAIDPHPHPPDFGAQLRCNGGKQAPCADQAEDGFDHGEHGEGAFHGRLGIGLGSGKLRVKGGGSCGCGCVLARLRREIWRGAHKKKV